MIVIASLGIAYVPVPKNACTSIKTALFELENGFEFRPYQINGTHFHIHNFHKSYESKLNLQVDADFLKHGFRFCVVRDPIERIISCYRNRVKKHGELKGTEFEKRINNVIEFAEALDEISDAVPSIRHHAEKQTSFLGKSPEVYTNIYNFRNLSKIAADLMEFCGSTITLPHLQKAGGDDDIEMTDSVRHGIQDRYSEDYDVFGSYF